MKIKTLNEWLNENFNDNDSLKEIINKNCRDFEDFFDANEIEFSEKFSDEEIKNILKFLKESTYFVGKSLSADGKRKKLNTFLKERFIIDKDDWSVFFIKNCILEFLEKNEDSPKLEEHLEIIKNLSNLPYKFNLTEYKSDLTGKNEDEDVIDEDDIDTEEENEEDTQDHIDLSYANSPGTIMCWLVTKDDVEWVHYSLFLYRIGDHIVILDPCTTSSGNLFGNYITINRVKEERKNSKFLGYFNIINKIV